QLLRRPRLQRIWLVVLPVRALVMVVGAQEIMHALRRAGHVAIGLARRVVPLIMFARPRQRSELAMHGIFGRRLGRFVGGVEGELWRGAPRGAPHRNAAGHVGAPPRAPPPDGGAANMAADTATPGRAAPRH